jgi:acetoin:2,6-dichlorophenolindophenol oxidoreductase subunit beta
VTAPHAPVPFSPPLEDLYIPSAERVADECRSLIRYAHTSR